MDHEQLWLDFHGIIKVRGRGLSSAHAATLKKNFPQFLKQSPVEEGTYDIEIQPMDEEVFRYLDVNLHKKFARLQLDFDRDDEPLVTMSYRGALDMVIQSREKVVLQFRPRNGGFGKFILCVHLCIIIALYRKNAMLFKGAVVSRGDCPIVLSGMSGAGKTSIMLHLLNDGWDYLSDNTYLLSDGHAHLFRKRVVFNYYHLTAFPEVFSQAEYLPEQKKARSRLRRQQFAVRRLPALLQREERFKRFLDPFLVRQPEELYPQCKILRRARPKVYLILRSGHTFRVRPIPREEAVRRLAVMHHLTWQAFHPLNYTVELSRGKPLYSLHEVVEANTHETFFHEVTLPGDGDLAAAYLKLKKHMDGILHEAYGGKPKPVDVYEDLVLAMK